MTLPVKYARRVVVNNGAVASIELDFRCESASDVHVFAAIPGIVELVQGVDYTVSGLNTDALLVTLINPAGWSEYTRFAVYYEYDVDQPNDIDVGGAFGLRFENALDRMTLILQSLADKIQRSVKMPLSSPVSQTNELIPVPNQLIGWNADGTALEGKVGDTIAQAEAAASAVAAAASAQLAADNAAAGLDALNEVIGEAEDAAEAAETAAGIAQFYAGTVTTPAVYDAIAEASAATVPPTTNTIILQGYYARGDGGNGTYLRVASEPTHAGKFQSADGAWWELAFGQALNVCQFGAVGDAGASGTTGTDDAPAFQAANDYLNLKSGGVIHYSKRHLIASDVVLSNGVSISGTVGRSDPGNPFSITTDFFNFMKNVPALIIAPSASIELDSAGGLTNVYAFRQGMALDGTDVPTDFSGTAFSGDVTDAVSVNGVSVIGFDKAFYFTNSSRLKFNDVLIDCNHGIHDLGNADINRYSNIHCYGVTQADVTGHQLISNRSGYALFFGGGSVGGPTISNFFSYGYEVGVFMSVPGSYTLSNIWIDGTTVEGTGKPLKSTTYGIIYTGDNNAEIMATNVKICCQNRGFTSGANNFGPMLLQNFVAWNNDTALDISGTNLRLVNAAIRSYFDNGILFNNAAAADSAKLVNVDFYNRAVGALTDINAGAGDPSLTNCGYLGGILNVQNIVRKTISPVSEALTIPNGKTYVRVNGSGNIGDILNKSDGTTVSLEFISAGSQLLGANFRLAGGFTATAGGSITLRYNQATSKWVEICRAN